DVLGERCSGRVSLLRLLAHRFQDDRVEVAREFRRPRARALRVLLAHEPDELGGVAGLDPVWLLARKELVEDDSEGIHVASRRDRAAAHLLGAPRSWGAEHD